MCMGRCLYTTPHSNMTRAMISAHLQAVVEIKKLHARERRPLGLRGGIAGAHDLWRDKIIHHCCGVFVCGARNLMVADKVLHARALLTDSFEVGFGEAGRGTRFGALGGGLWRPQLPYSCGECMLPW